MADRRTFEVEATLNLGQWHEVRWLYVQILYEILFTVNNYKHGDGAYLLGYVGQS